MDQNENEFSPNDGAKLATHVSSYGATVYMNKKALENLISELEKILKAKPEECYEVHISRFFSYFDSDENYREPPIKYAVGLEDFFEKIFEEDVLRETELGNSMQDVSRTPFEVTIMHVSDKTLQQDAASRVPIKGPVSWTVSSAQDC